MNVLAVAVQCDDILSGPPQVPYTVNLKADHILPH